MTGTNRVDLTDKVAFVTGGSGTIGSKICERLAESGARVSFLFKENEEAARTLQEKLSHRGFQTVAYQGDVRDRTRIAGILKTVGESFGPVTTLVHAAFWHRPTPFDGFGDREWDLSLAMNLKGITVCTQEAWPYMKARPLSSIIFPILRPKDDEVLDVLCAHGRLALMRSLAEFGKNIQCRCNAVWIDPAGNRNDRIPAGLARSADAVLTLAADSSLGLTGQTLEIR